MHSIERYGIVALLFLFVTIVAVLMWDSDETKSASKGAPHDVAGMKKEESVAAAPTAALEGAAAEKGAAAERGAAADKTEKGEGRRRLRLAAEPQPGPLFRDPPVPTTEVAGNAQGAPLEHESHAAESQLLQSDADAAPATTLTPREQPAPESVIAKATTHEYTVRTGDTLSAIAQHELGSARRWEELVAANPGLDPSKLRVGKKIQVPGASAAAPSEPRTAARTAVKDAPKGAGQTAPQSSKAGSKTAPVAAAGKTWKVGKGENLWKIAARALGDGKRWGEIVAVNPGLDPDRLVLGQVLALPASATSAGKGAQQNAPKSAPTRSTKSEPLVAAATPERSTRAGGKVK